MKRVIKAASIAQNEALDRARKIKVKAQELFDIMEDSPSGFLDANDLGVLYDELIDVLPGLDFAIKSNTVDIGMPQGPSEDM